MIRALLGVVVAGLAVCAVGAWFDPREAGVAWMVGQRLATSVAFGALSWLAVCELAPIRWFAALRPTARALGWGSVPAALGWVPVLALVGRIYPWAAHGDGAPWLSAPAFGLRTGAVLLLWVGLAATARTERRPAWALAVALIGAPAWCLLAFDAWMTLDPDWKSSVYAFVVLGAGLRDGLAAVILLGAASDDPVRFPPDLWHALGRLLLMTVVLVAYLEFSQFLVIWIAGVPSEIGYYLARGHGVAGIGSAALVAGTVGVAVPLLSRGLKRSRTAMIALAAGALAVGAVEAAWDVLPHADGPVAIWLVAASLAGWTAGIAALAWWARGDRDDEAVATTLAYRSR